MNVKKSERLYKSDRLNYIVNRMRVCHDITPARLAEELHISERTIYRDLRNLEKGSALQKRYSRREGRYLLETELNLPPLTLTPSEALALFTAASNPALSSDNFFAADLRSGLGKVGKLLTQPKQGDAPSPAKFTALAPPQPDSENSATEAGDTAAFVISSDSIQRPMLEIIRRAMRSNRKLRVAYWSASSDSEREMVVAPYDVRAVNHHWYLLANSEEHGAVRPFKISRIRRVELATDRFRFPRRFSADAVFARAWEQFGGTDDETDVIVRFAPTVANLVRDSRGHQFSQLIYEPDGSLVCTAPVTSVREISWWILSYGSRAEVLSPPELRAQFAQAAQEMASIYARPPAPVQAEVDVEELPVQAVVRRIEPSATAAA